MFVLKIVLIFTTIPAEIHQKNCLHCGNCMEVCPKKAVVWR
ncbi:MAG: 4Fe-4S dicluster domain-containing protein [Lachnospirales bacterium]